MTTTNLYNASVLIPNEFTESMLVSSTLPENDYPAWSAGTTYAIGDRVIDAHSIWESVRAGNLGKPPSDELSANWWQRLSATNRWRMFDGESSSQSLGAGGYTVVVRPGFFNTLALYGLAGGSVDVTVKAAPSGPVLHQQTYSLDGSDPGDWYEWYFGAFKQLTTLIIGDLAPSIDAEVTLTFNGTNAGCSICAFCDQRMIGITEWGAEAEPKDYSFVGDDPFGNTTIKRRKNTRNLRCTIVVKAGDANDVDALLSETASLPCGWVLSGASEHEALRTWGLGSGKLVFVNKNECSLPLQVKGLIAR